ncbi:MAG: hypothetical protein QG635_320, partial [Bacteroidota bacterium]|nr:hypothetical protein [Bacteroidota bacterium]
PREVDFKFGHGATFRDLESGEELVTQPYQIQREYTKVVHDFINHLKGECRRHNVDYHLIDTSQPFDKALKEYLAKRKKMRI